MKAPRPTPRSQPASDIMSELRVSGHLMRLEPGLFCVVQTPTPGADPQSGLPGIRLSLPPGPSGRPEGVQISGFGPGGWLSGAGDAALVRVSGGPAQIVVTIYQAMEAREGSAPNLQVTRLMDATGAMPMRGQAGPAPVGSAAASSPPPPTERAARAVEALAHIQERGDVGAMMGEWLGERGSGRWIEGFGLAPSGGVAAQDIEYQAVLGPGWLSPWVEGGQFCGSRGMALPVLGLRVRLRGEAAVAFDLSYAATFVDGSKAGPVGAGEPCESESLAAMESFRVELIPRRSEIGPSRAAAKAKPTLSATPAGPASRSSDRRGRPGVEASAVAPAPAPAPVPTPAPTPGAAAASGQQDKSGPEKPRKAKR